VPALPYPKLDASDKALRKSASIIVANALANIASQFSTRLFKALAKDTSSTPATVGLAAAFPQAKSSASASALSSLLWSMQATASCNASSQAWTRCISAIADSTTSTPSTGGSACELPKPRAFAESRAAINAGSLLLDIEVAREALTAITESFNFLASFTSSKPATPELEPHSKLSASAIAASSSL